MNRLSRPQVSWGQLGLLTLCLILLASLVACSTAPATAQTLQQQIAKACTVWGPVSQDVETLYTLSPEVDNAITAVDGVCAGAATVQTASLQSLVNTVIPAAITALKSIPGISATTQTNVGNALMLVQVGLAAALATYGTPSSAAAPPASAPVAASAPAA